MTCNRRSLRQGTRAFIVAIAFACCFASAAQAGAQNLRACDSDAVRRVAGAHGQLIDAIAVQSAAQDPLPVKLAAALHVTTRAHVVRSRLLFTVGDALDSLRVAESLRQLRALRFLAGASIRVACDSTGGVALTVTTRDVWSMWPRLSFRGSERSSAGLEEFNLLGTGRTLRAYLRSDYGQLGIGGGYSDPTLFRDRVVGSVVRDAYRHGMSWQASLRTQDRGVYAPWSFVLGAEQSSRRFVTRAASSAPGDSVARSSAIATVSHRVALTPDGALFLTAGVEAERTSLVAGPVLPVVGPAGVRRTIVAADVGLSRRSARFVDAPWLLPVSENRAQLTLTRAEVPVGIEFDGMLGVGRELTSRRAAAHLDMWAGRLWSLGRRTTDDAVLMPAALLSADAWASGYYIDGSGRWTAGALRASVAMTAPAWRGLWNLRISAEELSNPDPDVRSLALFDPAARAFPSRSRLAETAMTGSVERSVRVRPIGRGYVLDFAVVGAASMRREVASLPESTRSTCGESTSHEASVASEACGSEARDHLAVGSLGVGLRLAPTRFGRATIRLDAALPVLHSASVPGRPYLSISVVPAFGGGRNRARRVLGAR